MDNQAVFQLAVAAGEALLKNGAEIFRVQETVQRILDAYQMHPYDLYIVSNGLFVSAGSQKTFFALRHVSVTSIHLGRIAAVNALSRRIVKDPDIAKVQEYRTDLQVCIELADFPLWMLMLACGLGSGGFCYLLDGGIFDCVVAFFCGIVLQAFLSSYSKGKHSRFVYTLLGAALVSSIAFGAAFFFPVLSLDRIVIGAIISLVPGVALTTSLRDFFNEDFLSGTIHLNEAILTGVCIAVGVGAALHFWEFVTMGGIPV